MPGFMREPHEDTPIEVPEEGGFGGNILPLIMKVMGGLGGGGGAMGAVSSLAGLLGGGGAPPLPNQGGGGPTFNDITPSSQGVPAGNIAPTIGPGFVPGGGVQPSGGASIPTTTELQKTTNAAATAGEKTKPYVGPIQAPGGGLAPSGDDRMPATGPGTKTKTYEKKKEKEGAMGKWEKAATAASLAGALKNSAKGPALPGSSGFNRIDPASLQLIMKS